MTGCPSLTQSARRDFPFWLRPKRSAMSSAAILKPFLEQAILPNQPQSTHYSFARDFSLRFTAKFQNRPFLSPAFRSIFQLVLGATARRRREFFGPSAR